MVVICRKEQRAPWVRSTAWQLSGGAAVIHFTSEEKLWGYKTDAEATQARPSHAIQICCRDQLWMDPHSVLDRGWGGDESWKKQLRTTWVAMWDRKSFCFCQNQCQNCQSQLWLRAWAGCYKGWRVVCLGMEWAWQLRAERNGKREPTTKTQHWYWLLYFKRPEAPTCWKLLRRLRPFFLHN